ncbi:hypothetical protein VB005_11932 [Metarhizium brunneum]
MKFYTLLALSSTYLASHAASSALPRTQQASCSSLSGSNVHVVYQFAKGTWLENIAERTNGDLLVTLVDRPELYQIDHRNPVNATLVHKFPGYTSLLGISETSPDVFAIITEKSNISAEGRTGSCAIWTVSFDGDKRAQVSKITDVPEANFLNGMTTLDAKAGKILVSDSGRGLVLRVDIPYANYTTVLDNETFKPIPNASIPFGVNGIRVHNGYLYYTNTLASIYGRVKINLDTGEAVAPFETISSDILGDDFAIDRQGNAYIAANSKNEVVRVSRRGRTKVIAGSLNSTLVPGPTSAIFGKLPSSSGKQVLYVTTAGGLTGPINGTYVEGGKIIALEV